MTTVNTAAGREIAKYRVGFQELFPFAPDFWYAFPGYLPDGRMALAIEDAHTEPPTLCVITFDKRGRQTKEVIRVPIPDDVLKVPAREWYNHKDRFQQQLVDILGFRPSFIRVQNCHFPGDESRYNCPSPYMIHEFGQPDTDDEASWDLFPEGVRRSRLAQRPQRRVGVRLGPLRRQARADSFDVIHGRRPPVRIRINSSS